MPPAPIIDPQVRIDARLAAQASQNFVADLISKINAGTFGIGELMWLVGALANVSAAAARVVNAPNGKAAFAGELFDVYTGSDPGAIKYASDRFLPGLTPEDAESLFDAIKPMIEYAVAGPQSVTDVLWHYAEFALPGSPRVPTAPGTNTVIMPIVVACTLRGKSPFTPDQIESSREKVKAAVAKVGTWSDVQAYAASLWSILSPSNIAGLYEVTVFAGDSSDTVRVEPA